MAIGESNVSPNVYVVCPGDTLYGIAKSNNTTVENLVKINGLKNRDYIVVGQKLLLTVDPSATKPSDTRYYARPTILQFGLLSTSSNTLFASWEWTRANTANYALKWEYTTESWPDTWFAGESKVIDLSSGDTPIEWTKMATYTIPSEAARVRFTVKPNSARKEDNTVYWTAEWSTAQIYDVKDGPPSIPPIPSIEINDGLLLTKLENLSLNATGIQFQVLKRNGTRFDQFKLSNTTIQYIDETDLAERENGYARYSCYVDPNGEYKVRARAFRDTLYSDWSEYSGSVYSAPTAPGGITTIRASSETSVYLEWEAVDTAETYDIQYATELAHFDDSNEPVTETDIENNHFTITGLATGDEYFFRVRAVRESVASEWCEPVGVIVGKKPSAPTTWASSTTVITGEPLIFYWVHNSQDGSSMTEAELELTIGGVVDTITVLNSEPEETKDKMRSYEFDTSELYYGTVILWRVRTKGIFDEFSDWSIQRTVDIFAPPSLTLSVTNADGNDVESLSGLPMLIEATAGPYTQKPVSYYVSITADESYETLDAVGNPMIVSKNQEVFSRHYDISTPLAFKLSAGDVSLENNVRYTLTIEVTMDSGLTGTASKTFSTAWSGEELWPDAEIRIDTESYTATLRPYCMDPTGKLVGDNTVAVYRRNFDGTLTEIISGLPGDNGTHITDPHPALDYARYRIVATSTKTGAVSYYDIPGIKVGCYAIIIQWDEAWSNFDTPDAHIQREPSWVGSILKLPYNIDIRENARPDVSHIEYIGRQHPVNYHGTQLGESASWSTVIDKKDQDTLYALRRLARWNGRVYVREPSGSGYWATVVVSLDQRHDSLVIPVTLEVTRVEGGA